jgi:hypothetical protein
MTRTIRILSDWGFYPFYLDRGDGRFALVEPEDFRATFDLPEHVMCALLEWDEVYQDLLDRDDPRGSRWATTEDRQRYVARGRDAARLLRRHVPADVGIVYMAAGDVTEHH